MYVAIVKYISSYVAVCMQLCVMYILNLVCGECPHKLVCILMTMEWKMIASFLISANCKFFREFVRNKI